MLGRLPQSGQYRTLLPISVFWNVMRKGLCQMQRAKSRETPRMLPEEG